MIKKIIVSLVIVITLPPVHAVQYKASENSAYYDLVEELITSVVNPLLSSLFTERAITDEVTVVLSPNIGDLKSLKVAFATPYPSPTVTISDGFIFGLQRYIEATIVASEVRDPHLVERYFNYFQWRARPINDHHEPPLSPLQWAAEELESREGVQSLASQLLAVALVDVLMHEIGHHVNQGFYDQSTSKKKAREIEAQADQWAYETLESSSAVSAAIGRVLSVGYSYELSRWSRVTGAGSHPPHINRVAAPIAGVCHSKETQLKTLCKWLSRHSVSSFITKLDEEHYRKRVAAGDDYAHYPLGNLLLRRGRNEEACSHYRSAWEKAKIERASIHVGACYDQLYLKDRSNTAALVAAEKHYWIAAGFGFTDAKVYIKKFFD